jgi:hypothetical protein
MGSHLPSELRDEVRSLVGISLYKSDVVLHLNISEDPRFPNAVRLRMRSSFKVHNATDQRQEYPFKLGFQRLKQLSRSECVLLNAGAMRVVDARGERADYDFREPDRLRWSEHPDDHLLTWEERTYIPPKATGSTAPLFWYDSTQLLPRRGELTSYSQQPTVHLRVTVDYPENYTVRVTIGHRSQNELIRYPASRPTTWELHAAFLGMAATTIEWYRGEGPDDRRRGAALAGIEMRDGPCEPAVHVERANRRLSRLRVILVLVLHWLVNAHRRLDQERPADAPAGGGGGGSKAPPAGKGGGSPRARTQSG